MEGERRPVWLTREAIKNLLRVGGEATDYGVDEACRAALDGEGATVWWACFDPHAPDATPFLFLTESAAWEMHSSNPNVFGPPVQVVVVEVKK